MKKKYNKEQLKTITLHNAGGMEVTIMNFGGIITSIKVPVKGNKIECVLGFDSFDEYISDEYRTEYPYLGAIIGRNAGRIKYGKAIIEGKEVQLHCNLGENQIHGGEVGFDSVFWDVISEKKGDNSSVTLQYISKEGEEGYPGEVIAQVTYTLTADNRLRVDYYGTTTAPTILNLTQHTYFNLNENDTNVLNNTLQIKAEKYVPLEEGFFTPTGERPPVAGTPLDYRKGQRVYAHTDNSFVREITADEVMATLTNGEETLSMEVRTNHPVLHIYAGYYLPELKPIQRKAIGENKGICFEAQGYADATKHPQFDSVVLLPNEEYNYFTEFKFNTL
ncbi:aldose epimerase family protein [Capnocytophaga sp. oral taxon 878]|uniref:aldose epimerase family protein n=1 Tax=Capnocytophaga sp. oral taxon 878 TaxID=1316596 RepID=UPI000D03E6C4|nr:aldose epimerase family protein [Capnocytophaga sp. oral taxon 878]AVM49425.1 galactose-1-epimerase [Capnocytophaga sp. oral taxon 878]